MTGIVVSYAKPFGDNNFFGALSENFLRKFSPSQRAFHNELLNARNNLYAHLNGDEIARS
jgi:hypothetical protein